MAADVRASGARLASAVGLVFNLGMLPLSPKPVMFSRCPISKIQCVQPNLRPPAHAYGRAVVGDGGDGWATKMRPVASAALLALLLLTSVEG
ncbi:hypothetical protein C8F01DRAFT_1377072 [Mycena amicta]|nr:hypothetical protein C8F01DRAFT_1379725 [Mycena amicta]KAJ7051134.1 hypothetical protein C8F01DRAFT_1377072 [Mycena amicta]